MKAKRKNNFILALASLALAPVIAISSFVGTAATIADAAQLSTPQYGNYFTSDYSSMREATAASNALDYEIGSEGFTLLKNDNDTLPLAENSKVSLFGKVGSRVSQFAASLRQAGLSVNPTLVSFYDNDAQSGSGLGKRPDNGNVTAGYNHGETPKEMYTQSVKDSFANYNDAAIVVFTRIYAEGVDMPRTMMWNGESYGQAGLDATQLVPGARSTTDHYQQLDQYESDLLQMCGENFDKVIVVFATPSQLEAGFLDDTGHYAYHENIKAALWTGVPTAANVPPLGKILTGKINPSGHTVDTWGRDFKAEPVWQNFGNNMIEGTSATKGNQYANLPAENGGNRNNYVIYQEGIYIGYRYYETRGAVEGNVAWSGVAGERGNEPINGTTTTAWENWHKAHVVYPYGYGLSYTTFTQEIIAQDPVENSELNKDGTITLTVRVKNTGEVAGKEVVQLYYTAPYSTTSNIEKSHVVLAGFEKTKLLQPDEHQDIQISVKIQDMASYDWNDINGNGFKGYELEAGNYGIKIMKNAHDVLDSVRYVVSNTISYDKDATTGNKVENRFDEVSNYLINELGERYMSRSDFNGTFPKMHIRLTAPQWVVDGLEAQFNPALDPDTPSKPYYSDTVPTMNVQSGVKLADLYDKDYNDPLWDTLLNQFSYDHLRYLATRGSYSWGADWTPFGMKADPNADGPDGFHRWGNVGAPVGIYANFGGNSILAATFNRDLARRQGRAFGNEALWAGISGWYAPSCNIHRTPFGGRNHEYLGEDGYLSGSIAAEIIKGAQEYGLIPFVKHFAVNEMETNRCGLLTWASEQSMREIYFKPFELCVKVGKTKGIMSALNRLGYVWTGGSRELLTDILRTEWGFNGTVVTDSYSLTWGIADWMIRAGGNLALGWGELTYEEQSPTTVSCLRDMAHGILYSQANSLLINTAAEPVTPDKIESYNGLTLQPAILNGTYSADLGTATLSRVLYPDGDDSQITYALASGSRLPAGLSLSTDGKLTGSPTEEINNSSFVVEATFEDCTVSATFSLTVVNSNGSIIYEANSSLGNVVIGKACNLSVAGAKIYQPDATPEEIEKYPDVTYSIQNGSVLPEGLTLSADGKITGTPTKEAVDYKFIVTASALGYKDVDLEFTLSIGYEIGMGTAKTLAVGKYGTPYFDQLDQANCVQPVTYALKEGSALPNGLTLTKEGYVVGTPTQTVTNHAFVVVISATYATPVERTYQITIGISFTAFKLPDGEKGETYNTRVDFAQGVGMATYTATGLPEGLTLSEDGALTGTPTKAGVYDVTITANADGKAGDRIQLTLYVAGDNSTGLPVGAIIGIACGGVALVAGGIVLAIFLIKKNKGDKGGKSPKGPRGGGNNDPSAPKNGGNVSKTNQPESVKTENAATHTSKNVQRNATAKVKQKPFAVWSIVFTGLFVFLLICTIIATQVPFLYNTINAVMGGETRYLKSGNPEEYQYYTPDYESKDQTLKEANALNERICEEGSILLKNNGNVLPLAENTRVTVFGKNSVNPVLGGSGSSAGSAISGSDLYSSLQNAGLVYNPAMKSFYEGKASGDGRPVSPTFGTNLTGFPTGEASLDNAPKASYASDYKQAAIVVLSRIGGEGYDLPRTMFWDGKDYKYKGYENVDAPKVQQKVEGARNTDDHYLQLDKNEQATLKEACDKFDKVIVVINSSAPMELGFMDEDSTYNALKGYDIDASKIDAALWIGNTGASGMNALGKLLTGKVNPSGRTVDTYATDFKKDPTWQNFGTQLSEDGHRYIKSISDKGKINYANAWFVEYREGIYTGYRYYETKASYENAEWYQNNVVFPMGYGLSYTTFDWNVEATTASGSTLTDKDGKLEFTVTVTNTGAMDGKDVVQLYYTAPYTENGIEKSHVVLGDFAKTKVVTKNNGTQEVTLSLDVRDMASYDYADKNGNGFKGYEVEAGEYTVYIGKNAHCWADSSVDKFTYTVNGEGFKYDKDEVTNTPIKNLFNDVSNHLTDKGGEYLSRNNNFANWAKLQGATDTTYRTLNSAEISALTWKLNDKESDPWYTSHRPTQSQKEIARKDTTVRLYDLIGKGYNDPLWDTLLNQLTINQMSKLICTGNYRTLQIENIDKPLTTDPDGPMGFTVFMGDPTVYDTCYYASECVLGATWNKELAYEMGRMVGNEGLFGNVKGDERPYSGWYAPAMNLHRSQFGGRNFEYYSEDPYHSGILAANVAKGALSKGVYTYAKHFALNEEETNRDTTGRIVWANEQSMREMYYRPFEIYVKDGNATAMMSSFSRIGNVWAGGNYALLTELLRNEWGFEGMVITDYNLTDYMNLDQMIRAGGDLNLSAGKTLASTTTATDVTAMRQATKNILYTVANSNAMNGYGANVVWGYSIPWWVGLLIGLNCGIFLLAGALGAVAIVSKMKNKKEQTIENN